jgi:hypothetical protein
MVHRLWHKEHFMDRMTGWLGVALMVIGCAAVMALRGDAGGDKTPWQPIVPKEAYDELTKREVEYVKAALDNPTDATLSRGKFAAVLIAALTLSEKDKDSASELRGVREQAVRLAQKLTKPSLAEAKTLAADLFQQKTDATKALSIPWEGLLTITELMEPLHVKSKGGDGIHPDLQSNVKLKGTQNGIEEKLRNLTMKELNEAGMKKEAKELELLAYRTAVLGALTYYYAPPKAGKKDPEQWRQYSLKMRDNGVELAAAAKKGDTAAVLKASSHLYESCTQCHSQFK